RAALSYRWAALQPKEAKCSNKPKALFLLGSNVWCSHGSALLSCLQTVGHRRAQVGQLAVQPTHRRVELWTYDARILHLGESECPLTVSAPQHIDLANRVKALGGVGLECVE